MYDHILEHGPLTGSAIGIIMKELVRRAITEIRQQRFLFEAKEKVTPGKAVDFVTTADYAAQATYTRSLRECFPQFGIIAEEVGLRVPCTHSSGELHFSLGLLDGTKAFMRRQSHSMGPMLALWVHDFIDAAYIGDIMTQEIFGFRPGSNKVHRISEFERVEELTVDTERPLADQHCLLRKDPREYSPAIQELVRPVTKGGAFKGIEVSGGSIARLWKGEVGAIVVQPGWQTPWDTWPIISISDKLGFVFCRPSKNGFEKFEPKISLTIEEWENETLVIHESRWANDTVPPRLAQ